MKRATVFTVGFVWTMIFALHAQAGGKLYWDANGANPDFGTMSGTWGADVWWTTDATGSTVPTVAETSDADDVSFGTAVLPVASGLVGVQLSGNLGMLMMVR